MTAEQVDGLLYVVGLVSAGGLGWLLRDGLQEDRERAETEPPREVRLASFVAVVIAAGIGFAAAGAAH